MSTVSPTPNWMQTSYEVNESEKETLHIRLYACSCVNTDLFDMDKIVGKRFDIS